MKIIMTLIQFIIFHIALRILLKKGITRRWFALLTSLLYATLFLFLSIMFVYNDSIVIGVIMFLCMMIGGYPTAFLLYPLLQKAIVTK